MKRVVYNSIKCFLECLPSKQAEKKTANYLIYYHLIISSVVSFEGEKNMPLGNPPPNCCIL